MSKEKDGQACLSIGGQAVMEGVMMKGPHEYAVAVRRADGSIQLDMKDCEPISKKHKLLGLPLVRGVVNFCESMYIGMKTLTYSADIVMEDAGEKKADEKESWKDKALMTGTVIFAVLLALGIFIVLPSLISGFIQRFLIKATWIVNILEGLIRMAIFFGYVISISFMKDIQRVFEYHGAEHKTINCYESGQELTPDNALQCTRLNRRCGTSFLFLVMLISMLFFMVIQVSHPLYRILYRLLLIPVVAGVSYEILKFSNRSTSRIVGILVYPGLLLQKITTREPDREQIEVAIASFKAVLNKELGEDEAVDIEEIAVNEPT